MNTKPNGGSAFPAIPDYETLRTMKGVPESFRKVLDEKIAKLSGMSLRDWFAGQERLADFDDPEAAPSIELCEAVAGKRPEGGWKDGNMLAMFQWECKWRAALKYMRADAMIAEREK